MKNIIFASIIIAAAVGCSKTNTETQTKEAREIHLGSNISDISAKSKTAVNGDDAVSGLLFRRLDATTTPTNFNGAALVVGDRVNDATNITFATPQYYDLVKNTYFIGYFPAGNVGVEEGEDRSIMWKLDGKTDVMVTGKTIYDAGTDASPVVPVMAFNHELTQIDVIFKAETGKLSEVQTRWGKIEHIKCSATTEYVGFYFHDRTIMGMPSQADIALSQADYTTNFASIDIPADNNATTNAAGMFFIRGLQVLDLLVKTANQEERKVSVDLGAGNKFEAGKKHVITLTFNTKSINIKTTIEDWGTGAPGAAEVN